MFTKMAPPYNSTKFRLLIPNKAQKNPVLFFSNVHYSIDIQGSILQGNLIFGDVLHSNTRLFVSCLSYFEIDEYNGNLFVCMYFLPFLCRSSCELSVLASLFISCYLIFCTSLLLIYRPYLYLLYSLHISFETYFRKMC